MRLGIYIAIRYRNPASTIVDKSGRERTIAAPARRISLSVPGIRRLEPSTQNRRYWKKERLEMKLVLVGLAVVFLAGCAQQQNTNADAALQAKVSTLESQLNDLKPGLGEIMGVIQQHHAKLYYAGTKANWPLADYELTEIQENLDAAMHFYPGKFKDVRVPLPELIPAMTKGSIAQVREAIQQKNEKSFAQAYQALSTSCSSCHAAANDPFIRIKTPATGMFSDQNFAP
jgi:outer membrane murein-binding lipoprotein Lpp